MDVPPMTKTSGEGPVPRSIALLKQGDREAAQVIWLDCVCRLA
jgi:hypothetical protein